MRSSGPSLASQGCGRSSRGLRDGAAAAGWYPHHVMHDIPARPRAPCPREPGRRDAAGVFPATISRVWAGRRAKNKERQRRGKKRRRKKSKKNLGSPDPAASSAAGTPRTLSHRAGQDPVAGPCSGPNPPQGKCKARSLPYCIYVHRANTANNKSRPAFISPRVRLCTRPGPLPTSLAWAESPPACPPPGGFQVPSGRRKRGGRGRCRSITA